MSEAPAPYTPQQPGRSTAGTLTWLLAGPIVWAAHFMAIYALQGALCAGGASQGLITGLALVLTAPALAVLGVLLAAPMAAARLLRAHSWGAETAGFLSISVRLLAGLSIFGVVAAGLAAPLLLPACPALR